MIRFFFTVAVILGYIRSYFTDSSIIVSLRKRIILRHDRGGQEILPQPWLLLRTTQVERDESGNTDYFRMTTNHLQRATRLWQK